MELDLGTLQQCTPWEEVVGFTVTWSIIVQTGQSYEIRKVGGHTAKRKKNEAMSSFIFKTQI